MEHKNSVKAAIAAAALALSISGAQAQVISPLIPVGGNGAPVILPYSYYGPAYAVTPSVSYASPFVGYAFDNYDSDGYGTGNFGNYGYGYTYGPGYYGSPYGAASEQVVTPSVTKAAPASGNYEEFGGVGLEGDGVAPIPQDVAPNAPVSPYPQQNPADNSAMSPPSAGNSRSVQANPIVIKRAPYRHLDIAYRGSTYNVSSISMQLLDRSGRVVSQSVLNAPPAQAELRRPVNARFYRVILTYNDGTTRTVTHPIPLK